MNRTISRWLFALLAAIALVAAGCGDDDDDADVGGITETTVDDADDGGIDVDDTEETVPEGEEQAALGDIQEVTSGSVTVEDQESDGLILQVAEASIEGENGWVAIHIDEDGQPGRPIGAAAIEEGTSEDVDVILDRTIDSGTYWAIVHVDIERVGVFEFPGPDAVIGVDGEAVMQPFEVDVPEGVS